MYQISMTQLLQESISEDEYRALVERCPDSTVFNDWAWLITSIEYLGAKRKFIGIQVRDDRSELVGFLALHVSKERLHGVHLNVARFVQYPHGDRMAVLLCPEHLSALEPLLKFCNNCAGVYWDCMIWDEWTDTQGMLDQTKQWAKKYQIPIAHKETCKCPVLKLDYTSEEEMVDSYPSKMRTDLRRRKKKLRALHSEIIHLKPTPDEVPSYLEKIATTEKLSWKGGEGVGIFNDPNTHDFFSTLSQRLAKHGQLDLSLININNQVASYKYGFCFRKTFYDYNIGYLPQYSKFGLGRVLLDERALHSLRKGYTAVDASRVGQTTQHILFERTSDTISHHRLYWFGPSIKSWLLRFVIIHGKFRLKIYRDRYKNWKNEKRNTQSKTEK